MNYPAHIAGDDRSPPSAVVRRLKTSRKSSRGPIGPAIETSDYFGSARNHKNGRGLAALHDAAAQPGAFRNSARFWSAASPLPLLLRPFIGRLHELRILVLELGIWSFSGVWSLGFGVSAAVAANLRLPVPSIRSLRTCAILNL